MPVCPHCGTEFEYVGHGRPRVYCSDEHRFAAYRARRGPDRGAARRMREMRARLALERELKRYWTRG